MGVLGGWAFAYGRGTPVYKSMSLNYDLFICAMAGHASRPQSYIKRELNQNLSGDEVYYANSLILLVINMLCSKLHYQEGFNPILFLCRIFSSA